MDLKAFQTERMSVYALASVGYIYLTVEAESTSLHFQFPSFISTQNKQEYLFLSNASATDSENWAAHRAFPDINYHISLGNCHHRGSKQGSSLSS